jgi:endonuclease YncB( thermonuclease family)
MLLSLKSLALFLILLSIIPYRVWAWSGKVVGVASGELITVVRNGEPVTVLLYGIDCPEEQQPFSHEAQQFTAKMVLGKSAEIEQIREDKQGRIVAIVAVEKRLLNEELVKAGLGWVYSHSCNWPICETWKALQLRAKLDKRGLWQETEPTAPWVFRRKRKRNTGVSSD